VNELVPFLAGWSAFYLGVGTIASDLFVLIVVTGITRKRFAAGSRQWTWRAACGRLSCLAFPARGDREDLVITEAWISQISGVREISG
jgi:hypothetical protein